MGPRRGRADLLHAFDRALDPEDRVHRLAQLERASLDQAARGALANCRFTPALVHGQPVEKVGPVMSVWTLK